MLTGKLDRFRLAFSGLFVIASVLGGIGPQGLSSAAAQPPRSSPTSVVGNQDGEVGRGMFSLPDAIAGARAVDEYPGSIDARLLQAAMGFDPISVGSSMMGNGSPTRERFTTFNEMKKLPPIEKRYDPNYGEGPQPETVCGADGRTRIFGTTSNPWRWTCKLIMTFPDGVYVGTGWLVGPRCVITAGHCVHGGGTGQRWATKIEVIPGMNGSSRPYGTITSRRFFSVNGWTRDGNWEYDYAAIILPTNIGNRTGWFGYANYSNSTLNNMTMNTAGYPADKPNGTMWFMAGPINGVTARQLRYNVDTYGGQSGSSVWRLRDGKRYSVGIHAYGGCPNDATRINGSVFNFITNMKTK